MEKSLRQVFGFFLAVVAAVPIALSGEPVNFFQGFETDTAGWIAYPTITQMLAADAGVPANEGTGVGVVTGGAFTRFGAYSDVFPTGGFMTQLDVFIDPSVAPAGKKGWWYSVAISGTDGLHKGDFVFNTGNYNGQFYIDMATTSYGYWPPDPNGIHITSAGWYTLQHVFTHDGAVLSVAMTVIDKSTASVVGAPVVLTYTGVVGGNRYGWISASNNNGQTWPHPIVIDASELRLPNTAPVAICADVTVIADANGEADVSIDNGSFDPDGDPITLSQDPAGPYPIGVTLVTLTVTDDKGATDSCSAYVTVQGPMEIKQEVLMGLVSTLDPLTDKEDRAKLSDAIKHLLKSLSPERWLDSTHPMPVSGGEGVFNEEKPVVLRLRELRNSNDSGLSYDLMQGYIDALLDADRLLAETAIAEAKARNGKLVKIANAEAALLKGDEEAGTDHPDMAIDQYRNAWKSAIGA